MAVMGGAPVWAVLHAGGLLPAPTVPGVWLLGFIATFVTFGLALVAIVIIHPVSFTPPPIKLDPSERTDP